VESGIDALAATGPRPGAAHEPAEALAEWLRRYAELLGTKRGSAPALRSGDPACAAPSGYFMAKIGPVLATLLPTAAAAGTVRDDFGARDLLYAVANLRMPVPGEGPEYNERMVALLTEGPRPPRPTP